MGWVILYFIVYITVPCESGWGGGGVCVMYTIENHILHLWAGASQSRDSASQSRDKIPTALALVFCTIHPLYPTPNLYKSSRLSLAAAIGCPDFHLH